MKTIGFTITLVAIILAASLGSNASAFVDIPALLFVATVGFGILLASHGWQCVWQFLSSPFVSKVPNGQQMKMVAQTGMSAFVAAGWIGTLIGVVQMLSALDDPAKLGMGAAITLLTALYGYVIAYAICLPLSKAFAGESQSKRLAGE